MALGAGRSAVLHVEAQYPKNTLHNVLFCGLGMSRTQCQSHYKELNILLNIAVLFFTAIVLLYLVAPFFGGIFSLSAVVYYFSFIGMIVVAKYFLGKYEKNTEVNKAELIIKILYESLCYFLWLEAPVAFFFLLLGLIINIIGYRAYSRRLRLKLTKRRNATNSSSPPPANEK